MITIADVKTAAAVHFGVDVATLISPARMRPLCYQRQVAMFVARELTTASLPTIGRAFMRDHSTVKYALSQVQDDATAQRDIAAVRAIAGSPVFVSRRNPVLFASVRGAAL